MPETDKNEDLWMLLQNVRSLKEQLEEWQERSIRQFTDQMAVLDGLQSWCDSILLQVEQKSGALNDATKERIPDGE